MAPKPSDERERLRGAVMHALCGYGEAMYLKGRGNTPDQRLDMKAVWVAIDALAEFERDDLVFRVEALREGLQEVLDVDPRSDAMWFIANNALQCDNDRARMAVQE